MSDFMKKYRYILFGIILIIVITSFIFVITKIKENQENQRHKSIVILDADQKETWLDSERRIKSMNLVINSEIGFAVLYSNDYSERETVVEAGQSLLEDKWSGEITPAREFMLHGSTTGVNFDDLNWSEFEQARRELEARASALYNKKGYNMYFVFKIDMQSDYVWEKIKENENNKDE